MKQSNNPAIIIVYVIGYSIVLSLAIAVLIIFRPFRFIDNEKSQIVCNKNKTAFDIGPNYIYTLDQTLDQFNDIKARKLCEYSIIRDYGHNYETPNSVNYKFKPALAKDSSWGDAIVISSTVFLSGVLIVELMKKKILTNAVFYRKYLILSILFGLLFFAFAIRKPATQIFCFRQLAKKVVNFRNSAYKNGVYAVPEEDKHIKSSFNKLYLGCLKNNDY